MFDPEIGDDGARNMLHDRGILFATAFADRLRQPIFKTETKRLIGTTAIEDYLDSLLEQSGAHQPKHMMGPGLGEN